MRMCCVRCEVEHAGGHRHCPMCGSRMHALAAGMTPATLALYAKLMPARAMLAGCKDLAARAALRAEVAGLRRRMDEATMGEHPGVRP